LLPRPQPAVFDDILNVSEKARMAMKMDFPILRLIPFCVEEKVFAIQESVDLGCSVFLPVGYHHGVIVGNILFFNPLGHLIFLNVFQISPKSSIVATASVGKWSSTLFATLIHVIITGFALREFFKD